MTAKKSVGVISPLTERTTDSCFSLLSVPSASLRAWFPSLGGENALVAAMPRYEYPLRTYSIQNKWTRFPAGSGSLRKTALSPGRVLRGSSRATPRAVRIATACSKSDTCTARWHLSVMASFIISIRPRPMSPTKKFVLPSFNVNPNRSRYHSATA